MFAFLLLQYMLDNYCQSKTFNLCRSSVSIYATTKKIIFLLKEKWLICNTHFLTFENSFSFSLNLKTHQSAERGAGGGGGGLCISMRGALCLDNGICVGEVEEGSREGLFSRTPGLTVQLVPANQTGGFSS